MKETVLVVSAFVGIIYLAHTPYEPVVICSEYNISSCTDQELYNLGEGLYPTSQMTLEEIEKVTKVDI